RRPAPVARGGCPKAGALTRRGAGRARRATGGRWPMGRAGSRTSRGGGARRRARPVWTSATPRGAPLRPGGRSPGGRGARRAVGGPAASAAWPADGDSLLARAAGPPGSFATPSDDEPRNVLARPSILDKII